MSDRQPDKIFLVLLLAYVVFGLVMLASATGPVAFQKFNDAWWYAKHQLLNGVLPGLFLFAAFSRLDYRVWRRWAGPGFIAALALLMAVFLPGIGSDWGTSRSWIHLGDYSFQPIEAVKLLLIVFLAARFARDTEEEPRGAAASFWPFLAAVAAVGGLLILQPDLGGLLITAGIAFAVYFIAGAPWSHLAGLMVAGIAGAFALMKAAPYRANRLLTFLHPELDPRGIGYHINQAYLAIGSGGWFGLGLGHSRQKYQYLPEVAGDSIFAVMVEELGFLLTLAFLAALAYFIVRLLRIARSAPDGFGRLLAAGIAAWVTIQAACNIGSMVGVLPLTGLPLPLVSYGGSATMMLLAGMGVVANISAQSAADV